MKLLDFGISKLVDRSRTTTVMKGTLTYMAPDNFQANISDKVHINTKVDSWSFGCIMSEIFSREIPWSSLTNDDSTLISLLFQKKDFPIPQLINHDNVKKLLSKCLICNSDKRYCMRKIKNSLLYILEKELHFYEFDEEKYGENLCGDNEISNSLIKKEKKIVEKLKRHLDEYGMNYKVIIIC